MHDDPVEDDTTSNASEENIEEMNVNGIGNGNSESIEVKKRRRKVGYFKPYIELNSRHKQKQMKIVKDIIIKVTNPSSFQDEDYYNQYFHVLEDVINSFRRTRNTKENQVYIDYNAKASELSTELS